MAGPAYYTEMFPEATRLPEYYNNRVFVYDWIRGWIKAVTLNPMGILIRCGAFYGKYEAPFDDRF